MQFWKIIIFLMPFFITQSPTIIIIWSSSTEGSPKFLQVKYLVGSTEYLVGNAHYLILFGVILPVSFIVQLCSISAPFRIRMTVILQKLTIRLHVSSFLYREPKPRVKNIISFQLNDTFYASILIPVYLFTKYILIFLSSRF